MISTIQSYQLNNKIVPVDLAQVHELSASSKDILTNLSTHLPQSFQTVGPLKGRIQSMEETAQMLKETKEHRTRDKVIVFLKTASLVALLAGVIISCVYGFLPGAFLGTLAYLLLSVAFYCHSCEKIEKIEKKLPEHYSKPWYWPDLIDFDPRCFLPILGGGLIAPLFETFTRESRLERVLKQQQEFIGAALSDYKQQNDQSLSLAYQFYRDQFPTLRDGLNHKIEQLEKSLADMKQLAERSLPGENDLQARLATYQKAKDELNIIAGFYRQFDAVSQ